MKRRTGHLFLRDGIYWLRYSVDGKRVRQSLGTRDKREAITMRDKEMAPLAVAGRVKALKAVQAQLADAETTAATLADEANPPLTLADAWNAYLDAENRPRRAGEHTLPHYAGHLAAFMAWLKEHHPAAVYMRDVSPEMAAGFIRHLDKQGYSGNRVNKNLQFLKTLFRVLAKPGRIPANPFQDIARREHLGHTKRPLTIEELRAIIETAEGELKTLFMLGTFTGLRLGDCATLQWGEVDIARAIIRRIPNKTRRNGEAVIIGIPTILGAHLAQLERRGPAVMPDTAALYEARPWALTNRIQAHLEQCGVQTVKPGTGEGNDKRAVVQVGFHSLRHTFVSLHAQAGTPQAILQKLAGHGNPIMTEHYVHIDEGTARAAAAALPAIMGDTKPALPAREPLPPWAKDTLRELAGKLNARTLGTVKKQLLKLAT